MTRHDRRAFRSNARRYLLNDPDGRASVNAAAKWLRGLPLMAGLSEAQCRELVVGLRSEGRVIFVADHATEEIKLIESDGSALSPFTVLAGLSKLLSA